MEKGTLELLTPEKADKIRELRLYAENELNYDPRDLNTWSLIRFAQARNFDVELTKIMLANHAQFKQDAQRRELAAVDFGPSSDSPQSLFSNGFCGTDKQGRPVYYLRLGGCDWTAAAERFGEDAVVDFFVQGLERFLHIVLPLASEAAGKRVDRATAIIDFKNASPFTFTKGKVKAILEKITKTGQNCFPEILGRLYVVNTPTLFYVIWQIVKLWLHPNTRERIIIDSSLPKDKLFADIGAESLHESVGGKIKTDLRVNDGPWTQALQQSFRDKSFYMPNEDLVAKYYFTEEEKRKLKEQRARLVFDRARSLEDLGEEGTPQRIKSLRFVVSMTKF